MRVSVLAATAVPNDCGIWTFSRAMIKALLEHGSEQYRFELNSTQSDLARLPETDRAFFHEDFSSRVPTWAKKIDGHHPRYPTFDAIRDYIYEHWLNGWSISKGLYWNQSRCLSSARDTDVWHVPYQLLPFWPYHKGLVYVQNVHDFQQEYLPDLQRRRVEEIRRAEYGGYRRAAAVCVLGESVKEDAIRYAGIEPERIFVTPLGNWEMLPPSDDEERELLRQKFALPEEFIFYPAPTRPHKNHIRLLRALADLRAKGVRVPLVATGRQRPHYDEVEAVIQELGIGDQVFFTDYVKLEELNTLYDMATAVVLPTMFEGATGIPLLEAMSKGKAIAASAVCEIPAALGNNGLLFDPLSVSEIASAVGRLWESPALRCELASHAKRASRARSWKTFVQQCEAAYAYAHDHPNGF